MRWSAHDIRQAAIVRYALFVGAPLLAMTQPACAVETIGAEIIRSEMPTDGGAEAPQCTNLSVTETTTLADGAGGPVRWSMDDGCIRVTYSQEFADGVDDLRDALRSWLSPCTSICFALASSPSVDAPRSRDDRRIHFEVGEPRYATDVSTAVTFVPETGVLRNAVTTMTAALFAGPTRRAVLARHVGHALGFSSSTEGESALLVGSNVTQPTSEDLRALCCDYPNR